MPLKNCLPRRVAVTMVVEAVVIAVLVISVLVATAH